MKKLLKMSATASCALLLAGQGFADHKECGTSGEYVGPNEPNNQEFTTEQDVATARVSEEPQFVERTECADQTGSSTREQTTDFVGSLNDRITQARGSFGSKRNRTASLGQPKGGAASADGIGDDGRWSPFVVLDSSDSDRRATTISRAYEQDADILVLGADYRWTDDIIAGATLSYLSSETDYDDQSGEVESESIILGFHASKYWGETYLDALLSYGQLDLDIERSSGFSEFDSSTDGAFHSAEVAFGHMFSHRSWTITPSVRLLNVRGEIDGYTEDVVSGSGAITYEDQKFDSLNARAAIQADYVLLADWGVLIPSLYFAFHHEFAEADAVVTNNGLRQFGDDPVSNYRAGRINLAAQFKRGFSGFITYERLIDHELLDRDTVVIGARVEL
ncbi:uncharacterized protein YhjY with autotransporter beta-barrel domain [Litorivivens lipolytica]|uniref:Uncharacterized protein YhjY with autotransporter beta-barrel domain n=1 Tax=Litorivivens lipolytica TaxID=1524264 RepID=A0A7W4W345_9GAMM|nr:autotransporter outer membrane beta-barrel domain-containing protein [Litorivivens lipolytica]MBB3046273.1 uncharacterized protein YhjY with autotransporter beta-barrel domain [Litorivivens lipolytica]